MQFISFNNELGLANILFARLFKNIQIERVDRRGASSWMRVPCVNAKRSRIVKALENPERRAQYQLPLIAYSRTGYSRTSERLNNLHNEVKYEITSSNRNYSLLTPVPIDIQYDVVVMAKYQGDIDKIASNFMVFFNSDVYVSQNHPKYDGIKLNNQVIMSDSVSEEHPDELDGSQDDLVTTTFNFTFKTYLFGGTTQAKLKKVQISSYISSVVSSYVYEFKDDAEVSAHLAKPCHSALSTTLTAMVDVPVSELVETSSDEGAEVYDDGIPTVGKIDFGFYAVPNRYDIEGFMTSVDTGVFGDHYHTDISGYISSEGYTAEYKEISDDWGNAHTVSSEIVPYGDVYAVTDSECSLAPYVDRIRWTIDSDDERPFPYNAKWERCPDTP